MIVMRVLHMVNVVNKQWRSQVYKDGCTEFKISVLIVHYD
jgi:hypothetical protein